MSKLKYYTLSNDIIFKNTFNTDKSLKRLLEESLEVKVQKIYQSNIEMPVDKRRERRKYLDLILKTDKGIYNVEVNHGYKEELPNRNLLYLCKLISTNVKRKKSYVNVDKHIQLNLTWNLKKYLAYDIKDRKIIKFHLSDDKTHNKIYEDVFEIVHVNMDYFEDVWYHGDVKKENPFLMLLAAPTEEKMDEISEGDKLMEELNDKVKKLNEDSNILDVIIENEDEIIANSMYEKGIEKGRQEGIEQGIEKGKQKGIEQGIEKGISQGISKGAKQKSIEIAEKLLNIGLPLEDIKKATGLSIQKIKSLNTDK